MRECGVMYVAGLFSFEMNLRCSFFANSGTAHNLFCLLLIQSWLKTTTSLSYVSMESCKCGTRYICEVLNSHSLRVDGAHLHQPKELTGVSGTYPFEDPEGSTGSGIFQQAVNFGSNGYTSSAFLRQMEEICAPRNLRLSQKCVALAWS